MGSRHRPRPPSDDLIVASLQGAAQRLGGWDPPVGQERQVAVADLREIGGGRADLYARAAGIMLGNHPDGDRSHALYRNGAELLLEAGGLAVDDERVQAWIRVGEQRRARTREAHRAGDIHDRPFNDRRLEES